jgi:hypothetical protein
MNLLDEIQPIKCMFIAKEINYEEAKKLAKPIIDAYNEKAKVIAKKYNKKPIKLQFAGLFR